MYDNPVQKSMEMWQKFGTAYMENMMQMFEKSLSNSQAMQRQVQDAVSTMLKDTPMEGMVSMMDVAVAESKAMQDTIQSMVNDAVQAQFDVLLDNMQTMQTQIEMMRDSVAEMTEKMAGKEDA